MSNKNNSFNLAQLIISIFKKAEEAESKAEEEFKKAEIFSAKNRKEISERQEEFKRKWQ